jgi:antitoxin (DNA-binding transcriptional repressor) of toxin-antitoxin stability system
MQIINVSEAKAQLSALIKKVLDGAEEIIFAVAGDGKKCAVSDPSVICI